MQNPISLFRSMLQWFRTTRRAQSEQPLGDPSQAKEQAVEPLSPERFREMFAGMLADPETRRAIMRSLATYFPVQGGAACPNVTSDGTATAYSVALFTTACNIQSAKIFQSNGNVGIGTAAPALQLQISKAMGAGVNSVTFSATPTFDASLGNTQKITLTANVTSSTLSNAAAGEWLVFDIIQDATGGRTFAWPTNVLNAAVIGSAPSKHNIQMFYYDGTNARAVGPMLKDQG